MEIKLVSWTNKPLETIYWAFMNMHNEIPSSLDNINISQDELKSFMEMMITQPHQTVFEYVNTVWIFKGVSRAFQQQLTRTRQASFSIQSLRIVKTTDFATNKLYTISEKTKNDEKMNSIYQETMEHIQKKYNELIDLGCSTEDARGILPLNIHSPITMAINLRSLYHLLELRFCENTQEEFRFVANEMKKEVIEKMSPLLAMPMQPICFKSKTCPSPVPCSKYNFPKAIKMDVSKWIKG